VLAYEMLTDANPFAADTLEGAAFKADYAELPAPSEFEPGLPDALDDILLAALDPDPGLRYPSVARFVDALLVHLGDSQEGRADLAETVKALVGDEEQGAHRAVGLWDRWSHFQGPLRRVLSGLLCGWLAYAGLAPLDLGTAPSAGAALLVIAAAAAMPQLGLALGLIVVSAGFFLDSVLAGVVFALSATAFWLWLGRSGRLSALAPVAAPAFGMLPGAFALPLLLGFAVSPLNAALLAGWSAAALHTAAAMSGGTAPYLDVALGLFTRPWAGAARVEAVAELFATPGPVAAILAWAAAAAVMSLACRSGSRAGAVIGVVAGILVVVGGYALWGVFDPAVVVDGGPVLEHVAGSLILMTVVIGLGAPVWGASP
jgi:hypothetical protein